MYRNRDRSVSRAQRYLETVLKPILIYNTHLFPLEKTNFKRNIARYYFQNKSFLMKIDKHSKLKIGFKTVSNLFLRAHIF
jgi:hypothetical protein